MSRAAAVDKLPAEIKTELKQRLRAAGYGELDENVEWLRERGHSTSRSALGRFALRLKTLDKAGEALTELVGSDDGAITDEAAALLVELGSLRVRERRILDRLIELT